MAATYAIKLHKWVLHITIVATNYIGTEHPFRLT